MNLHIKYSCTLVSKKVPFCKYQNPNSYSFRNKKAPEHQGSYIFKDKIHSFQPLEVFLALKTHFWDRQRLLSSDLSQNALNGTFVVTSHHLVMALFTQAVYFLCMISFSIIINTFIYTFIYQGFSVHI